ncbi:MAG: class I SAM-dependent methyltransferase [Corynebacterium sp.]|uniref:class I SAM-dependent methyltransferase n=1 Tax=Corynebacterium sp. TaxID=1720 RepID=UPI0026DA7B6D|nr:class I SAM-dependent methyltransferase [Corynebacterium sp.]MDO5098238.1 class I SAM-dependent methyltransferase [Corynebacterium sp.]
MPTWNELIAANPAHSINYANRWRHFEENGEDIYGEARLIDAIAARGSVIIDAGCGQGRLTGYLGKQGHKVIGSDLDPILIDIAREQHPDLEFHVGDLCVDPLPISDADIVFSAGNVMGFLPVEGRKGALSHIFAALKPGGLAVIGFGAGRGWDFDDFLALATEVGFTIEQKFSSWELAPFAKESDFLVAFFRK